MEYAKNFPCIYGALGGGEDIIKLGTTYNVANRKSGYSTAWAWKPIYKFVIVIVPECIHNTADLYKLDADFLQYMNRIGLGQYHISRGGGTEFYSTSCPTPYLEILKDFLVEQSISILTIIEDDPFPIRNLTSHEDSILLKETCDIRNIKDTIILKENFFRTFLPPGTSPRRIQLELWDIMVSICFDENHENIYKGIIQWPTGTGKTIGILMMIVLIAEQCKRYGNIYRGLFVAPKNDIIATISNNFVKLSLFDINVYDGSVGKLSKLTMPLNRHIIVMACPDSLRIEETGMKHLPPITHVHYDEVHRVTGKLYFELLQEMLVTWNTSFLTGTSATPKTSDPEQHRKIGELFGDPYKIIHKCDVDEAVREGWIATPRFIVKITPKIADKEGQEIYIKAFVNGLIETIIDKKSKELWRGGKVIAYLGSIANAKAAAEYTMKNISNAIVYLGVGDERTDYNFIKAPADGQLRILFACDRYREGSDIVGLDMTAILIGNTISAYILIQILGRALRKDYEGKEGWCLIVSPCEEHETIDSIFDRIALDIITFVGEKKNLERQDFERHVAVYMGDVNIAGEIISNKETIDRIQAAYLRREYPKRTSKEKYNTVCQLNKEMGLTSKYEYHDKSATHIRFIEDPEKYFKDCWNCWYDFLGVDYSAFPQTKTEWIRVCKERGIITMEDYMKKCSKDLPKYPGHLYEDYTNWDSEMMTEEEIVW